MLLGSTKIEYDTSVFQRFVCVDVWGQRIQQTERLYGRFYFGLGYDVRGGLGTLA
jgi:hypothetical protein